jgi:hypothetical protein
MVKFAIGLMLLGACPAFAQGLNGQSVWNDMSDEQKSSYIAGYYDGITASISNISGVDIYDDDFLHCLGKTDITTKELVDFVELEYRRDGEWWSTAGVMLSNRLRRDCLPFINQRRSERGLEALER